MLHRLHGHIVEPSKRKSMKPYLHTLEFEVRDYECDLQGIVNNANYQHYLEHARHACLKTLGMDFVALASEGIFLVVFRIEIDYKTPLRPGDRFLVCSDIERVSRLRFAFVQDIYRLPDEVIAINSRVTGTSMNSAGRPILPKEVEALLERHAKPVEASS